MTLQVLRIEVHRAQIAIRVALHLIDEHPFDILISDIGMPGKNGYEMMREIRLLGIRIPAIAVTAYARLEDRSLALQAGFQSHISKPIEPSELLFKITSLLQPQSN